MWAAAVGEAIGSFVGVLGALVLFLLGIRRERNKDEEKQEWELATMFQLFFEELNDHRSALRTYELHGSLAKLHRPPLSVSTWDQTRSTIARSEHVGLWGDLAIYYSNLRTFIWMHELPVPTETNPSELPGISNTLAKLRQGNEELRTRIQELLLTGIKGRE